MKLKLSITLQLLFALNSFAQSSSETQQNSDAKPLDNEFLDFNAMRLNGKLPLVTKTKSLYQLLGKPDSLITPTQEECAPFFDKPVQYAHFKKSVFEVFGDTVALTTINFKNNPKIELVTPLITLNQKTTLKDLEKLFPNAVKEKQPLNDFYAGEVTAINIRPSKEASDDYCMLYIIDDKLISIHYWTPCID